MASITVPRSGVEALPTLSSPNATQENRVRGRRANTASTRNTRLRNQSSSGANARRLNNLNRAKAAQNPATAPKAAAPSTPTAPIPKGVVGVGGSAAAGKTSAAAGTGLLGAAPGSVPAATVIGGALALGGGLVIGNSIYEDILDRPWGESLGDRLFPRDYPQRDGSSEAYPIPGSGGVPGGQGAGVRYSVGIRVFFMLRGELESALVKGVVVGPISGIKVGPIVSGNNAGGFGVGISPLDQEGVYRREFNRIHSFVSANWEYIDRLDGKPDTDGDRPPSPTPSPPSQPFQRPEPLPAPQPLPNPYPIGEPWPNPVPQPSPFPQPFPTPLPAPAPFPRPTPFPEQRPAAGNPDPFPRPAPYPSPSPLPRPFSPLVPTQPPIGTSNSSSPPSSRGKEQCACSPGIVSSVINNIDNSIDARGQCDLSDVEKSLSEILEALQGSGPEEKCDLSDVEKSLSEILEALQGSGSGGIDLSPCEQDTPLLKSYDGSGLSGIYAALAAVTDALGVIHQNAKCAPSMGDLNKDIAILLGEMNEKLIAVYQRSGSDEDFPISVPANIASDDNAIEILESLPELMIYSIKQIDAISGKFPIKIELTDTDPNTPGDQSEEVSFPNQAEMMAEMFGVAYESNLNIQTLVLMMMRLVPEVVSSKNSSIVTQDFVTTIAEYMGMRTEDKPIKVPCNFNPANATSLNTLMTESEQQLKGVKDADPHTMVEWLQKIFWYSQIAATPHFRGKEEFDVLAQEIKAFTEEPGEKSEADWEKFIDNMNSQFSSFNRTPGAERPKVFTLDNLDDQNQPLPQP